MRPMSAYTSASDCGSHTSVANPVARSSATTRSWPGTVSEVSTRSGSSAWTAATSRSRSRPVLGNDATTSGG